MTSPAWDPSMPLRWDASDEEIEARVLRVEGTRWTDYAVVPVARELAAASVAHALHERDGDEACVYIWSAEHREFWRHDGSGYTPNISDAGLYSLADAIGHTSHCGPEKGIVLLREVDDAILAAGFRRSPVQERGADKERLTALHDALVSYSQHDPECVRFDDPMGGPCECGLDDALKSSADLVRAIARSASPPTGETT